MAKYNLSEHKLATATSLDRWLYWLLHADDYEPARLLELFPEQAFQLASSDEGIKEGEIKGKIETIRLLQNLLGLAVTSETELSNYPLDQLHAITINLQKQFQNRRYSQ